MNTDIKQVIIDLLNPEQMVFLATSQDAQPYVRPMTLIYNQERFFMATGSNDTKAAQIASNPRVEVCLYFKDEKYSGYVRFKGLLNLVISQEVRKEIYDTVAYLGNYWKEATDPGYILYQLDVNQAEYMSPGESIATKIPWI